MQVNVMAIKTWSYHHPLQRVKCGGNMAFFITHYINILHKSLRIIGFAFTKFLWSFVIGIPGLVKTLEERGISHVTIEMKVINFQHVVAQRHLCILLFNLTRPSSDKVALLFKNIKIWMSNIDYLIN